MLVCIGTTRKAKISNAMGYIVYSIDNVLLCVLCVLDTIRVDFPVGFKQHRKSWPMLTKARISLNFGDQYVCSDDLKPGSVGPEL